MLYNFVAGYDRAPRSLAAKVLGCFWMVFVTLTIVTYISSYVNHMFWASTLHKHIGDPNVSPIRDLIDLVNHKDGYTYGCVRCVLVPVFSSLRLLCSYFSFDFVFPLYNL